MKFIFPFLLIGVSLIGCGGGGSESGTSSTASSPVAASQVQKLCGIDVGANVLDGLVTEVHDGDTITVAGSGTTYKVRLDSIDAPELGQSFGSTSQSALSNLVLRKTVKVAYAKKDQYDRIVGAVFTDNCRYINLDQVATGAAWFYKAYQCEVSAAVRAQMVEAQNHAASAKLGLWAQSNPQAPWIYRNGGEPVTPTCSSDLPAWSTDSAQSSTVATAPVDSSTTVPVSSGNSGSTGVCYVGPRGGTYTLTPSGNKNYGGC